MSAAQSPERVGDEPIATDGTAPDQPVLDLETRTVSAHGDSVHLTRAEMTILTRLMRSPGYVISRERLRDVLCDAASGDDPPSPKIIDVFVCKLRRKLARIGCGDLIATVWGEGFRIAGPEPGIAMTLTLFDWTALQILVAAAERPGIPAAARAIIQRRDR